MSKATQVILVFLFVSCFHQSSIRAQVTNQVTQAPAVMSLPTTTAATTVQCPTAYCQNNGVCSTNCTNSTFCCTCAAGFLGSRCETQRQQTVILVLKSNTVYTADLNDPNSNAYKALAAQYASLAYTAMSVYYNSTGVYVVFTVRVIGFSNGSVLANTAIDAATTTPGATVPAPTESGMRTALASAVQSCGAACNSLSLDTNFTQLTVNPNLCLYNTTNACSQYSTCTFYSGVNYTCTCINGYNSNNTGAIPGQICTRSCSTPSNPCGKGSCTERYGMDVQCNCPTGISGTYCQIGGSNQIKQSGVVLSSFMMLPLAGLSYFRGWN